MGRTSRAVLIIDDHRSYAEALAIAMDAYEDLRCVGVADTGAAGLRAVAQLRPDVVLVDIDAPGPGGVELVSRLRAVRTDLPVVAMTARVDAELVATASASGACALLRKASSVRVVLSSLQRAEAGPLLVDADTLAVVVEQSRCAPPRLAAHEAERMRLTPREADVLGLLAAGLDTRRIATQLGISIHTTRGHLKSLLAKFDVHTQLELVVRAMALGLVPTAPPRQMLRPAYVPAPVPA